LAKQAAEFTKQKLILEGQGEAAKKKLIMQADGALKQKLEAIIAIHGNYADAYKHRQVPQWYHTGGANGKNGSFDDDFSAFFKLMSAQIAKDVAFDMSVKK
jgi:hypothetical protein